MQSLVDLLNLGQEHDLPTLSEMGITLDLDKDDLIHVLAGAVIVSREGDIHATELLVLNAMLWGSLIGYYYAVKKLGDEVLDAQRPKP